MKLSSKILLVTIAIFSAGMVYLWPYIQMDFAGSAVYTEQDRIKYDFYTPDVLKNIPRVSDHYVFGYSNVSGPGLLIFDVTFTGATDTTRISSYLKKNGYQRFNSCNCTGECWRGSEPNTTVSVDIIQKLKTIIVSVVEEPY